MIIIVLSGSMETINLAEAEAIKYTDDFFEGVEVVDEPLALFWMS